MYHNNNNNNNNNNTSPQPSRSRWADVVVVLVQLRRLSFPGLRNCGGGDDGGSGGGDDGMSPGDQQQRLGQETAPPTLAHQHQDQHQQNGRVLANDRQN